MAIHLLPPEVASQIAAGEVIERPASVVKELVENSLDAGSHFISIAIEGAGREMIEVSDDGCGIPAEELALAFARHATSKLNKAEDLFHITTLGFRGEALASIGSVTRLVITSRPQNSKNGSRILIEAGQIGEMQSIGAPIGTVVRVENLFFNLPARLKFLKSDATERSQISSLVAHYALAYSMVRFHLYQEGKSILQTSGNGNRREALGVLYEVKIARQMLEILAEYDDIRVTGYISPTTLTRSNRREIIFFVNGRPVQDVSLTTALIQAYHNLLMVGRYPLAVIFLEMPPEAIDVNVHPTKAEVRFRNRDLVFSAVQRAVRVGLMAYNPIPAIYSQADVLSGQNFIKPIPEQTTDPAWDMSREAWKNSIDQKHGIQTLYPTTRAETSTTSIPLLRLVGQLASTYLVAEGPDGLYLIDQHAAHERILFEQFMAQRTGTIPSQTLLQPVTVHLPPAYDQLLSEQMPILSKLGFQVEPFGPGTYLIRSIPTILSGSDPSSDLRVVVEDFEEDETPLSAEIEARIIARICKKAAVKAGQTLSTDEQRALLLNLEACSSPRTCPHGRPTMIHLSVNLLERQFGRRGAR